MNNKRLRFAVWAAVWLAGASAFGQANAYVLDLAWKTLAFTNRPALGETAEIELRNIGSSDPTNLTMYLSNVAGDMLAVTEGMEATGTYARAELALTSTNMLAEFEGIQTSGSRNFDFTVWDSARSRLLASAKIEVRHNPMWESMAFTNLPALEDMGLAEYLVWGEMSSNATPSITLTVDLAMKNLSASGRMAVGERSAILLKNCGDANPEGLLLYLSNREGTGLALQSGASGTTNAGEALAILNLATTNLVGEFSGSTPTAEKALNLTIWDSERDRMLGSQPVPVRNNPLASKFLYGWTNVPDEVESELLASVAASAANSALALAAATNAAAAAAAAQGSAATAQSTANAAFTAVSNLQPGATQLIINVAGASARTSTLEGSTMIISDLPVPAAGLGTITGATVTEGSPLGVTTNPAGVLAFTIPPPGTSGTATSTNAPVPFIIHIADGSTQTIARGTATYYFIHLTNATQTIRFDAGFDATVGASILIDILGTNSLTVSAGSGPVSWVNNVWLRTNAVVPVVFSKPYASTNWTGWEQ